MPFVMKTKTRGWVLDEWLERLTANAAVATVLGSIPASSDTVESEGRQMKQTRISFVKTVHSWKDLLQQANFKHQRSNKPELGLVQKDPMRVVKASTRFLIRISGWHSCFNRDTLKIGKCWCVQYLVKNFYSGICSLESDASILGKNRFKDLLVSCTYITHRSHFKILQYTNHYYIGTAHENDIAVSYWKGTWNFFAVLIGSNSPLPSARSGMLYLWKTDGV